MRHLQGPKNSLENSSLETGSPHIAVPSTVLKGGVPVDSSDNHPARNDVSAGARENNMTNDNLNTPNLQGPHLHKFESIDANTSTERANFWDLYSQLAKQENAWISKFLNENLDAMLIFAGLLSAVVTAFLVESTKLLQPDPAEVSVSLLLTIARLQQQQQGNLPPSQGSLAPVDIPVFSVPGYAIAVNVLWFLALSLSLAASLLSLLAKEWLRHYDHYSSDNPLSRAMEHQKKLQAMKRCYGFEIIDLIPFLIHKALFLFGFGLVIYLWRLSLAVSLVTLTSFTLIGLFYLIATVFGAFTDNTPFVTGVSRYMKSAISRCKRVFRVGSYRSVNSDLESTIYPSNTATNNQVTNLRASELESDHELHQNPEPLDKSTCDPKFLFDALLWVHSVVGDMQADSLIEIMSVMQFDWGLESLIGRARGRVRVINRYKPGMSQPYRTPTVFLHSLGRGAPGYGLAQAHDSVRLYIMVARRLETLNSKFSLQENNTAIASVNVARSATVLANLCTYIYDRSAGWADCSGNQTMSVMLTSQNVLNKLWKQNYHLLSADACASVIVAELRLIFLIALSLATEQEFVWKMPNQKMKSSPDFVREVAACYYSATARTTLQLMRHLDGTAQLSDVKLGDLIDEITRTMKYITAFGFAKDSQDVPLVIAVPTGKSILTNYTLHPPEYGISGELTQVLFPLAKVHPKAVIQQKVDLALRVIGDVFIGKLPDLKDNTPQNSLPNRDQKTGPLQVYINVEFFATADTFEEQQLIRNQILALWPWSRSMDKSFGEQAASQLLTIASLYIININRGSNEQFPTSSHAAHFLRIALNFESSREWRDWPRALHWLMVKAFNVQMKINNGVSPDLYDQMAELVLQATPHVGVETPQELDDFILTLSNQIIESWLHDKLDRILQDLAKNPLRRQWCYSHYFHKLEPLSKLLLLAVYNPRVKTSIMNFVTSLMYTGVGESREIDESARLDVCALESFLLVANFAMLPSFPVSDQENPIATEDIPSFANAALRLLTDHSPSSLEGDPERTKILEGLQYVWEKVRGESTEPLDLSLESVRDKLRVAANPPVEAPEAAEERPEDNESSPNPQNEA